MSCRAVVVTAGLVLLAASMIASTQLPRETPVITTSRIDGSS